MLTVKFGWSTLLFSLLFYFIGLIVGDPSCGFPAIPNHAQIEGFSWDLDRFKTFEPGFQLIFSCHSGYSSIQKIRTTKTCSTNGTWIGGDIQCYGTIGPIFNNIVINASEIYGGKSKWNEAYNKEFVGEIEFVMPEIKKIAFVEIHLATNELNSSSSSKSYLPETSIGKKDCILQNESNVFSSASQRIYSCSSTTTKSLIVRFPQPVKIQNVTVYTLSENKCNGHPEIPLNAMAEMVRLYTVLYHCREGFILQGTETRSCNPHSGLWLPNAPLCEKASVCPLTGLPILLTVIPIVVLAGTLIKVDRKMKIMENPFYSVLHNSNVHSKHAALSFRSEKKGFYENASLILSLSSLLKTNTSSLDCKPSDTCSTQLFLAVIESPASVQQV